MIPLHMGPDSTYRAESYNPKKKSSAYVLGKIKSYLRSIITDKDSRNIFFFLCINLSFTVVELLYGLWTNSLGLISDAFHMLFDCTALLVGLICAVIARWPKNHRFTYGYRRAEVLAGFVNGIFLVFVAFFVFSESIERLMEPPEVSTDRLLLVSVLGFLVNLVGIFVFQHGGAHGHSHGGGGHGHSHGGHGHSHGDDVHNKSSHRNHIMDGVFLHVLADTLGSVGVIISTICMEQFGWMYADPICSMCIAIMIFVSVIPLLKSSACILLQRTPFELDDELNSTCQRILTIDGVLNFRDVHVWTLSSDSIMGTIYILFHPKADVYAAIHKIKYMFRNVGVHELVVQPELATDSMLQQMQNVQAGTQQSTPTRMGMSNTDVRHGVASHSSTSLSQHSHPQESNAHQPAAVHHY